MIVEIAVAAVGYALVGAVVFVFGSAYDMRAAAREGDTFSHEDIKFNAWASVFWPVVVPLVVLITLVGGLGGACMTVARLVARVDKLPEVKARETARLEREVLDD